MKGFKQGMLGSDLHSRKTTLLLFDECTGQVRGKNESQKNI